MSDQQTQELNRARDQLDRAIRCTCGSRAVIEAKRHSADCLRRLWIEYLDALAARSVQVERPDEDAEREASLLARLGRIRAMAESDPDLPKALADFIMVNTPSPSLAARLPVRPDEHEGASLERRQRAIKDAAESVRSGLERGTERN